MIRIPAIAAALCLAIFLLLSPTKAQANVVCSLTGQTINFGTSNTGTGSIGYSCISYNFTSTTLTLCSQIGSPSYPGTAAQPAMIDSFGNDLLFKLYTDAARTTVWTGNTILSKSITIPANATVTGSMPFYGAITAGQVTPAGNYTGYFYSTSLGTVSLGLCLQNVLLVFDGTNNTLTATATVINACTVSASNLALGSVASTTTAIAGSTTLSILCPSGTAYYIGLAPSNASTTGAGTLTGTGGNADHPPYQLRSTSGAAGTIWGNTATATSVGNGVSGTGTGATQSRTVYVTMPSANYKPDSYSDTVTVHVNY